MNTNDVPRAVPAGLPAPLDRFLRLLVHWLKNISSHDVGHDGNDSVMTALRNLASVAGLALAKALQASFRLTDLEANAISLGDRAAIGEAAYVEAHVLKHRVTAIEAATASTGGEMAAYSEVRQLRLLVNAMEADLAAIADSPDNGFLFLEAAYPNEYIEDEDGNPLWRET